MKMQKTISLFLFVLTFCLAFNQIIEAQDKSEMHPSVQTASTEDKIKYQFTGDGSSFTIQPGWDNSRKMLRMQHSDEKDLVRYEEYFNRAVKRGSTILVTGDKPRFALMYTEQSDKTDPD